MDHTVWFSLRVLYVEKKKLKSTFLERLLRRPPRRSRAPPRPESDTTMLIFIARPKSEIKLRPHFSVSFFLQSFAYRPMGLRYIDLLRARRHHS